MTSSILSRKLIKNAKGSIKKNQKNHRARSLDYARQSHLNAGRSSAKAGDNFFSFKIGLELYLFSQLKKKILLDVTIHHFVLIFFLPFFPFTPYFLRSDPDFKLNCLFQS